MIHTCTILPEYFEGNHYCNVNGGAIGCPIDRAIHAANVPIEGDSYALTKNIPIKRQLDKQDIDETVQAMFRGDIPIQPITFYIYTP